MIKKRYAKKVISFILILAMLLPGMQAFAAEATSTQSGNKWTLENEVIRTEIEFTNEGRLQINSFFNKRAGREYLPQGQALNRSSLFSYSYRLLESNQTGKETIGAVKTLTASDSGYTLGTPTVQNLSMTTEKGISSIIGKRLELPVTKDGITITLSFEIYDGNAGLKYQTYIRNNSADKRLQITASDVLKLDMPDEPRNLHYTCITKWKSNTTGVDQADCGKASEDIKVLINLYQSGDGFYIGPEVNSKTQVYKRDPSVPDSGQAYMARAFAGISAFKGKQVTVSTNPEALQLVLFPQEQFEYIAVNLTAFTGDIVDAKMAVEEHLRTRFKYNHTSTILNTNDWQWGNGKRSEAFYKSTAVPITKQAGFDMVMFDDGWNNADSNGTSRDGVTPLPSYTDNMNRLADYYKNEGLLFGLWYSLSGGYHNRGNDLADPAVIAAKKEKIQYMIDNYHLVHQMIDLTQFWLNDEVTEYSHPTDNVYRKNVLSKDLMNGIVEENPEYKVKYTTEVDIWPSQGDRSNELLHVINNGWTTSSTEYGETLDISLFGGQFGHLPLNSVYFNSGNMSTGDMSSFYKYMFARNIKHGASPDTWSPANIELAGKFNAWRKSPRIQALTDTIIRPVYAGEGWDSNVAANWNQNAGPYVLMHVSENKDQALMIATGGGKPGAAAVDVNLRWLDKNKSYLVEDITLDDTGIVSYRFKGLLTGDQLKSFKIDLDENTTKGKAYWIQEFADQPYQTLYADENFQNSSLTMDGSLIKISGTGKANSSGKIIVYGKNENAAMAVTVHFDGTGKGSLVIDQFESTDDVFIPSLPSPATYIASDLFDQGKTTLSGGTQTKVAGGTTPNASTFGLNFTSSTATAGSYVEFAVNVAKAGVYQVQVASKVSTSRGRGQWYIEGNKAGALWNQNESEKIKFHDLGTVTFASTGEKKFRFRFEGSSNKVLNTDRILLTPVLTEPNPTYEAENASLITASSGASVSTANDPGASGGKWVAGAIPSVGDSVYLTLDVQQPGTYVVAAAHRIGTEKGTAQLLINGEAVGEPFDQYAAAPAFQEHAYGRYTFPEPGSYVFAFQVTGKHEASAKYDISIDKIKLEAVPPRMVITGSTDMEVGEQAALQARAEGIAALYTTGDYVKWIIADQQPAAGTGRVLSLIPEGLTAKIRGVNAGTAKLKAMSTVSGEVAAEVTIVVNGTVVVPPQITSVTVDGVRVVGKPLTANVAFIKGDKDANPDDFEYVWNRSGSPISGANERSYIPTKVDLGSEIRLAVIPVDIAGTRGAFAESAPVFVVDAPEQELPQALNVKIDTEAANIVAGQTVTAVYDYYHALSEAEQGTTVQWYTVSDEDLANRSIIPGATGLSFTPTAEMIGHYLQVEITPRCAAQEGSPVTALAAGPVLAAPIEPSPSPSSSPTPTPTAAPTATPTTAPTAKPEEGNSSFPGFKTEEVLLSSAGVGLSKRSGTAFVSGYPDHTFKPDKAITREEAMTMLYHLVANGDKQIVNVTGNPFQDVKATAYSLNAILYFAEKGLVSGIGDGRFAPAKPMTRAELAKLLAPFLPDKASSPAPTFKDVEGHWAEEAIQQLAGQGLMVGFEDHSFRPDGELTRAQIVTVLCRLLGREPAASDEQAANTFTDLNVNHWAYGYIKEAAQ
ncbi:hypothetical protein BK120_27265 [Paenibacillus sp. FSL A5-0031]|uniref:S-layer homology domain-containing protein n=1 Tax=Paenibacillus sp. FSL A5-0031 TaxID=1920420 RepID=UPI00096E9FFB|nr:S-layer homology domain-containing protein [Paenibacillus sp. FSL A5-0031]OME77227.1 hypothetical protein BK120_27265 [Paenibacillus sp. FSL A5-0031]